MKSFTHLGSGFKNSEVPIQILVKAENSSHVTTTITVVWRRPYRKHGFVEMITPPFHHELMSTTNEIELIYL